MYRLVNDTGLWCQRPYGLWRNHLARLRLQPGRQNQQEGANNDPVSLVQTQPRGNQVSYRNHHNNPISPQTIQRARFICCSTISNITTVFSRFLKYHNCWLRITSCMVSFIITESSFWWLFRPFSITFSPVIFSISIPLHSFLSISSSLFYSIDLNTTFVFQ